jgi:hypothetical protein
MDEVKMDAGTLERRRRATGELRGQRSLLAPSDGSEYVCFRARRQIDSTTLRLHRPITAHIEPPLQGRDRVVTNGVNAIEGWARVGQGEEFD